MSLIIAFLLLLTALLWFVIGSKGSWKIKILFIGVSLYLGVGISYSLGNLKGWPATSDLPAKFELHGMLISEPNKRTGMPGKIYLWVSELEPEVVTPMWRDPFEYFLVQDKSEPRVFEFEYNSKLHIQLNTWSQMLQTGTAIAGEFIPEDLREGEESRGDFVFYPLPPPALPEKKYK